jgi:hypothetical protein
MTAQAAQTRRHTACTLDSSRAALFRLIHQAALTVVLSWRDDVHRAFDLLPGDSPRIVPGQHIPVNGRMLHHFSRPWVCHR